jgi:hypothetical protein
LRQYDELKKEQKLRGDEEKAKIAQTAKENEYKVLNNKYNDSKTKIDTFLTTRDAAKKTWDDYKKKDGATDAKKKEYENAYNAAVKEYDGAKKTYDTIATNFTKLANEKQRIEEAAREKKLEQQKNKVYNTARDDAKNYSMIKKTLEPIIATLKKRLEAESDAKKKAEI